MSSNNYFGFDFMMMPTYYCDISTPYFIVNQSACVSQCPPGLVQNDITLTCDSCFLGCYDCLNGSQCIQCTQGFFMRADNMCYSTCL